MKYFLTPILLICMGCTSLHTVSLTTIPAQRNKVIKAEASKVVFLGFTFDNDFIDDMEVQLKNQCPNGVVSGILTKDEVVNYFLFIVWQQKVSARGYCVKPVTALNDKNEDSLQALSEEDLLSEKPL